MEVKGNCLACGKHVYGSDKNGEELDADLTIKISEEDREKFLTFTQTLQADFRDRGDGRAGELFIPPSKYPKQPVVIPSPGSNPCHHCKIGQDMVGPTGCGRASTCMAYMYVMLDVLNEKTQGTPVEIVRALQSMAKKRKRKTKSSLKVVTK